MSSKHIGPFSQAWYKWKALRLPWRKRFLIGFDLQGNTYWEFRLTHGSSPDERAERWRRIVKYPNSTHLSQVKVSPLWHQWLRYTRQDPPSIAEQHDDATRRARMKYLAAEADARWDAKPRYMDGPKPASAAVQDPSSTMQQSLPPLEGAGLDRGKVVSSTPEPATTKGTDTANGAPSKKEAGHAEDPWAKARAHGAGENWQPTAWNPSSSNTTNKSR